MADSARAELVDLAHGEDARASSRRPRRCVTARRTTPLAGAELDRRRPPASGSLAPVARRRARCARRPRTTAVPLVERRSRSDVPLAAEDDARVLARHELVGQHEVVALGARPMRTTSADDSWRAPARAPWVTSSRIMPPRIAATRASGAHWRARTRSRQATWATVLSAATRSLSPRLASAATILSSASAAAGVALRARARRWPRTSAMRAPGVLAPCRRFEQSSPRVGVRVARRRRSTAIHVALTCL